VSITIDWGTRVISIPKADMTLIQSSPFEIRQLDLDAFRLALKAMEESDEGMVFPDTHRHNTAVTLGGITIARVIEIINGYTVTFEDGQYAVNAVGANSNLADVLNLNQVSLRSFNSAGLIVVAIGSGLSSEEHDKLMSAAEEATLEDHVETVLAAYDPPKVEEIRLNIIDLLSDTAFIKKVEGGKWAIEGDQMVFYDEDNTTEVMRFDITRDPVGNPIMRERV
jgi:hypothetical protein